MPLTRTKDVCPNKREDEIGISEILIRYFLVFVNFIVIIFWAKALVNANAAKNWPSIDGIVLSSLVGERIDLEGDVLYTAVVTYQYSVNSSSYVSHRITTGRETHSSSRSAKVKADQYPEGMIVKVYYDPDSPDKALLEPEGSLGSGLNLVMCGGVALAVIGITSQIGICIKREADIG